MQIGLIRHGETDWNAIKRIQGQTDIPLNETGIQQAKLLAQRLVGDHQKWDYIISSDLQRAFVTGQHIADALQIKMLDPDKRLRERYFGQVEGTTLKERIEKWGEEWRDLDLGAESDAAMSARGIAFLQELHSTYGDCNILCVSHGSFIAQLLIALFPDVEDSVIGNLSYSIISFDGIEWRLVLHNCSKHLEQSVNVKIT